MKIASNDNPASIMLELTPITEVLDKTTWRPTWNDNGVALDQYMQTGAYIMYSYSSMVA